MARISTIVEYRDGAASIELVYCNEKIAGSVWTDGEGDCWHFRAVGEIQGYWSPDVQDFPTRSAALAAA